MDYKVEFDGVCSENLLERVVDGLCHVNKRTPFGEDATHRKIRVRIRDGKIKGYGVFDYEYRELIRYELVR